MRTVLCRASGAHECIMCAESGYIQFAHFLLLNKMESDMNTITQQYLALLGSLSQAAHAANNDEHHVRIVSKITRKGSRTCAIFSTPYIHEGPETEKVRKQMLRLLGTDCTTLYDWTHWTHDTHHIITARYSSRCRDHFRPLEGHLHTALITGLTQRWQYFFLAVLAYRSQVLLERRSCSLHDCTVFLRGVKKHWPCRCAFRLHGSGWERYPIRQRKTRCPRIKPFSPASCATINPHCQYILPRAGKRWRWRMPRCFLL